MIYSPEVPVGAVPPANYPPEPTLLKECKAATAFAATCLLARALRHALAGTEVVNLIGVLLLATTAFAVVSGVFLGRRRYLGSRYAHGSWEWWKMIALLPFVYFCTVRYALRGGSLEILASGMCVGCHVVFLDRVALLQSFGVKIVRVDGLHQMNKVELSVLVFFSACCAFIAARMGYHLLQDREGQLRIMTIYVVVGVSLYTVKCLPRFQRAAFHSHHYFNSLLVLPLTAYEGLLPCYLCGMALGSFVEGCACWGVDPIYHDPLSKGVDFGVLFWTSIVPMLTSQRGTRWVEFLRNVQPLAKAVENAAAAKASTNPIASSLARAGKDLSLKRAAVFARDLKNAESAASCADLDSIRTGPNIATASLIQALIAGTDDGTMILLAFAETVLLGLLLGGEDLHRMASASGSDLSLECLVFNDEARSATHELQRSYRAFRRSCFDGHQQDSLVSIKQRLICALFSMDGSVPLHRKLD